MPDSGESSQAGEKGPCLRLCPNLSIYHGPIFGNLTGSEVMRRLRAEVHDAFPRKTASTSVTMQTV